MVFKIQKSRHTLTRTKFTSRKGWTSFGRGCQYLSVPVCESISPFVFVMCICVSVRIGMYQYIPVCNQSMYLYVSVCIYNQCICMYLYVFLNMESYSTQACFFPYCMYHMYELEHICINQYLPVCMHVSFHMCISVCTCMYRMCLYVFWI